MASKQKAAPVKWQSREIVDLLRRKHSEDVFVTECKSGPTTSGSHVRLDAWAMPRSWAHPHTSGYEIKVSRGDWMRDEKWDAYLALCNKLYIVCPRGLISADEIPDSVGLIHAVVGESGRRLVTVRKAHARPVAHPESLWRYILMSRAEIATNGRPVSPHTPEEWRAWLERDAELTRYGRRCSRKVAKLLDGMKSDRDDDKRFEGLLDAERQSQIYSRLLRRAGIWGCVERQEVQQQIRERLAAGSASKLRNVLLEHLGTLDNQVKHTISAVDKLTAISVEDED